MTATEHVWERWYHGSTPWRLENEQGPGRELYLVYAVYVDASASLDGDFPLRLRDRLDRVRVLETETAVCIGIDQTIEGRGEVAVVGANVRVPVRLRKPLGRRELRHAPVDEEMRRDLTPRLEVPAVTIAGPGPGGSGPKAWR